MREDRSKIQSIKLQEITHSKHESIIYGETITKIELNLENSEDDIDFVGYGTMRVSSKKDSSRSPSEIKHKFTKISPAKDLSKELGVDKEKMLTTRPFTPNTTDKKHHVRETTTSTHHQVVAQQTHSHFMSLNQRRGQNSSQWYIGHNNHEEEVVNS